MELETIESPDDTPPLRLELILENVEEMGLFYHFLNQPMATVAATVVAKDVSDKKVPDIPTVDPLWADKVAEVRIKIEAHLRKHGGDCVNGLLYHHSRWGLDKPGNLGRRGVPLCRRGYCEYKSPYCL